MKRFILLVVAFQMLFCACSNKYLKHEVKESTSAANEVNTESLQGKIEYEEMRAVWISCFELPKADQGEEKFMLKTDEIFKKLRDKDYNTAFVHVRPYADSIYPSEIFPWSKYCCDGKNPNFDPLKIIIKSANKYNISVHAWINPFRISSNDDVASLAASSPARKMYADDSGDVIVLPCGIYFNPASLNVHALIFKGVEEILKNYSVDGIHIDDYFYPATDEKIDAKEFQEYKKSGGEMKLEQWRMDSLSAFMSGLHSLTQKYGKLLSVSPSGNLKYNAEKMYADVELWMGEAGYTDIIIPQIYYGFENKKLPFIKTVETWMQIKRDESVRLVCGLAPYKVNKIDYNAGTQGENEWEENKNIIQQQKEYLKAHNEVNGFADFSYSFIP